MISLCHPHFLSKLSVLIWDQQHIYIRFPCCSALLWHFSSCPATEWGCSTAGHISPSPLPPALNQGPPILSLPLCTTLPLSLSTQFLLDGESCSAAYREQHCWRIFSYLPVPAEKGEEGNIFSLDLTSPPQCLLCLALCWWCWFPYGMTTAPAALHHLSFLTRAPWECSLVGWMDFSTLYLGLVLEETHHHQLWESCQVGCYWGWDQGREAYTWRILKWTISNICDGKR